jgi:hypothetical protein
VTCDPPAKLAVELFALVHVALDVAPATHVKVALVTLLPL